MTYEFIQKFIGKISTGLSLILIGALLWWLFYFEITHLSVLFLATVLFSFGGILLLLKIENLERIYQFGFPIGFACISSIIIGLIKLGEIIFNEIAQFDEELIILSLVLVFTVLTIWSFNENKK